MLLCVMATVDGKADFRDALRCFESSWQDYCRHMLHASHSFHHLELEGVRHNYTEIVKTWARIRDISKNSIVLPAYMLNDLITFLLLGVLENVYYSSHSSNTGYWACGIFSAISIA